MQIKSLRNKSYRSIKIDEREVSAVALCRRRKLEVYSSLRESGCSENAAFRAIEVSRATIYRWHALYRAHGINEPSPKSTRPNVVRQPCWNKDIQQQVFQLRRKHPLWGKKTLWAVLRRDKSLKAPISTVGRILKKLIKLGRVKPVCYYYGHLSSKRARVFNQHAKRWKKGMKAKVPGQLVQVDHMSISLLRGMSIKHFNATCPVTKITVCLSYDNAFARQRHNFFLWLSKTPFKLDSIQVDGGSEFRNIFEDACAKSNIELFVLRSGHLN